MNRSTIIVISVAALLTASSLALWIGTGRHYYTKFEVVERVEVSVSSDDILAQTGFYDGEAQVQTVRRDEFHFGLLPTPQGLFDKHVISVVSVTVPVWTVAVVVAWLFHRRKPIIINLDR